MVVSRSDGRTRVWTAVLFPVWKLTAFGTYGMADKPASSAFTSCSWSTEIMGLRCVGASIGDEFTASESILGRNMTKRLHQNTTI